MYILKLLIKKQLLLNSPLTAEISEDTKTETDKSMDKIKLDHSDNVNSL